MRTIRIEYTTKQGILFAEVPVDEDVYVDELNLQIEKWIKENIKEEVLSFKIAKYY